MASMRAPRLGVSILCQPMTLLFGLHLTTEIHATNTPALLSSPMVDPCSKPEPHHPSSDSKTPRSNNPNSNKSAQRVSEETNSSGGLRHPRMGPAVNPATIHSRLIRPAHDKSYEGSKWSLETQLEAVRYGWARNQSGCNPRRMGGQTRAVGILRGGPR